LRASASSRPSGPCNDPWRLRGTPWKSSTWIDGCSAREIVEQWRELFAGGFVTEEDVVMVEIDLTVEELDAVGIEHAYLRKQLELLQYFHSASGGEAKQE
jgi:hypothetical protein